MSKNNLSIGIIIVIVGIAMIIISETVSFTCKVTEYHDAGFLGRIPYTETRINNELKNGILYGGVILFVLGGVVIAAGLNKTKGNKNKLDNRYFCTECGTRLSTNDKFCPNCGTQIDNDMVKSDFNINIHDNTSQCTSNEDTLEFCYYCGFELKNKVEFCPNCGKKL